MSLSWRDRLHVVLAPRRVILVRLARGLADRVVAKEIVACPPAQAGEPPWRPALAALETILPRRPWKNAEVRAILSNHFVHYLVVPWQEKVTGEEEQAALVRYSFAEVYGEAVEGWEILWNEGRPPAPLLACAADRRLLAGLREICAGAGLPLVAIQPYLMAAFNRWRRELDGRRDWFLLAEEGRLCLAWFQEDDWAGVNCRQVGQGWGQELPQILDRALLLAGRDSPPERLCIAAPETPAGEMALADGWSGSVLKLPARPGFAPAEDAAYAMALNA
ncbi:MAG: hypothetical protein H6R10_2336 [Rhodocyclaceae bacterium]|nr:hypothetical protein [Rhodocyclaceae bacterium]